MLRNSKTRKTATTATQKKTLDLKKRAIPFDNQKYFLSSITQYKSMMIQNSQTNNGFNEIHKSNAILSNDENEYYLKDDENVDGRNNKKILTNYNDNTLIIPSTESIPSKSIDSSSTRNINDDLNENELFEGFCIDILRLIAKMVGFEYDIKLVPDGKYGVYDLETGEWNGIVRELMDKVSIIDLINHLHFVFDNQKVLYQSAFKSFNMN